MDQATVRGRALSLRETVVDYLSLERNVAIASAAVFLLGFGEELWKKFLPKYMEALARARQSSDSLAPRKIFRRYLPISWRLDRESPGTPPCVSHLHCTLFSRILSLPIQ